MRIQCLQHEHYEGLANIGRWAEARQVETRHIKLNEGERLPARHDYDWLIIMGGPMGVYEEAKFPWMKAEKRFIAEAIEANKTVLGVCLGAQLLADVLGARVYPGPEKEIGWFPVKATAQKKESLLNDFPDVFSPLHWHGDTFELPTGAKQLYGSEAYPQQAFQLGQRVLGLQFHLELSAEDVQAFTSNAALPKGRFIEPGESILAQHKNFELSEGLLLSLLSKLGEIE